MSESATPVLVAGARTPIGRFRGALADRSGVELGAAAVRAALDRAPGLEPDYVVLGNVLQAAGGQNPGRRAALAGGVKREVPGITVNDVCLASLSAVGLAAGMLREGEATLRAGRRLRLDDRRAARRPRAQRRGARRPSR